MNKLLTKSKYLLGLQSKRLLWIAFHESERMLKPDKIAKYRFKVGNEIGRMATSLYPEGIDLSSIIKNVKNAEKTQEKLVNNQPIFEAGFLCDDLYVRVDILLPSKNGSWDIIEVKSSSSVKDIHIDDVSFQKYVCEKAGIKINKSFLMHLNKEYVRKGARDTKKLLVKKDITKEVEEALEGVEPRIQGMIDVIDQETIPEFDINDLETMEYDNVVKKEFFDSLPEQNVFDLYYVGKKARELYLEGKQGIKDIPENYKLTPKQNIQFECAKTNMPHVQKEKIQNFIEQLKYPIYFLDFETFGSAIPLFDNTKPYSQIPFQYSLHIQEKQGEKPQHIGFLYNKPDDPRKSFITSLQENLGEKGTILVWNESFEKRILKESVDVMPEYKEWLEENILPRIQDLLIPFREFHYYNPKQKGSASIKKVLPIFSNLDYKGLDINKGDIAGIEYLNMMHNGVSDGDRVKIKLALEAYCELDTLAEVEILAGLKKLLIRKV